MDDKPRSITRRAAINLGARGIAGAGAAALLPSLLPAQSPGSTRALVGVYLFGGRELAFLAPASGGGGKGSKGAASTDSVTIRSRTTKAAFSLHPSLAPLKDLYSQNAAAFVSRVPAESTGTGMEQRYASLHFLPEAFTAARWAVTEAEGRGVFTFSSGITVVAPSASVSGGSFENPVLLDAMARARSTRVSFPATTLGQQLASVCRLIQAGPSLGMGTQVFLCGLSGFTSGAQSDGRQPALLAHLAQALTAFYAATAELGVASQVTAFTDSEASLGDRIVVGGSVLGGDVYGGLAGDSAGALAQRYAAALAAWLGVTYADLPSLFPGLSGPPLSILA